MGIDYLDNYLGFILKKREFNNSIILITTSMGQEANPNFDEKKLSKYEIKIKDMNLILMKINFGKHLKH